MSVISILGAGFSGLSAAASLAQAGHEVSVYEKNSSPGGRARKFEEKGFVFDMGPSWYWMPDVFESFYHQFGNSASDFYKLIRLDPSYRVFFSKQDILDVPAGIEALSEMFEKREHGSGERLMKFLAEAKYKYEVGINRLVRKPGLSVIELMDSQLLAGIFKLDVFNSLASHVRKNFKDPGLRQLLEFPVLFLGAPAEKIPALYSLMNYADMSLGTWYPMGGMLKIVDAMHQIAKRQGVTFHFDSEVTSFEIDNQRIKSFHVNGSSRPADYVVASADYHHVEQNLLPQGARRYNEAYWQSRTLAPSSLIFYLGVNARVRNLLHHNLFFDQDFGLHANEIYHHPSWPTNPLFYVCSPSKSDPSPAPAGCENLFILIPVAPGLEDNDEIREKYFKIVMDRLEDLIGQPIRNKIAVKRSYAHRDFMQDYHAFKGNAYGLANTIFQTANLKPSIINKRVKNLFYTGQLTVPGPGVPPAIISGQVAAQELLKMEKRQKEN